MTGSTTAWNRVSLSATFEEWTQSRAVASLGTNSGAARLPFQTWKHFKEAFAPELVARAFSESPIPVNRCLDPFGGSGTTALASQFLGVHPITIEVNPFLADLIEAKLALYDTDRLARDLRTVVKAASGKSADPAALFANAPLTLVEPGVKNRWIFDAKVASRITAFRHAIDGLSTDEHRRLFRVLLGGILVEVSNIFVNGKGRRYRSGWQARRRNADDVDNLFCKSAHRAIIEIHRYRNRTCLTWEVLRGDCRDILKDSIPAEVIVFSPPYPNSFDYTDVYNVELWTLGYLKDKEQNHSLRTSTLSSHVQVLRSYPAAPTESQTLTQVINKLSQLRSQLWNRSIPEMVGGYFAELIFILSHLYDSLTDGGLLWMVVGDSSYKDVKITTSDIIAELAPSAGWVVNRIEPFRSMRASPQQGGQHKLAESLVVLAKN